MNFALFAKAGQKMQERIYKDLVATEGSYEDFINLVYQDIDEICTYMLTEVELHRDQTETQLSHYIWSMLRMKWDTAQKDSYNNGNADLSITLGSYVWIAEAKIWGGKNKYNYSYLHGGYKQLTERYSKGQVNATAGAMFIYIMPNNKKHTELAVMENWQKYLKKSLAENLTSLTPCNLKSSCVYSAQLHSSTEYKYNIRHIPITLLHIPRDKSGLNAEKYKAIADEYDHNDDPVDLDEVEKPS